MLSPTALLFFLLYSAAILITHLARLALNFVQAANRVQCLFGQLAFIRRVQIEKLATRIEGCELFMIKRSQPTPTRIYG